MKNLILVRHGKSSWSFDVSDRDRPLKERGVNDGHLIAGKFREKKLQVDAIYSSPANRALHTCTIFLRKLRYPYEKFQLSEELYEFSGEDVMTFARNLDNSLDTVMIFGHNYAYTNVANQWGNLSIDNVPTTGLVHLQFDTNNWKDIGNENGQTIQTLFPKDFK